MRLRPARRRVNEGTRTFHEISAGGPVIQVTDATVRYELGSLSIKRDNTFRAVDEVSLSVARGRSCGVVGESGCGKSSLARSIMGLAPLSSGTISIGEREKVRGERERTSRRIARSVQMVFQDPFSSLNPRQSVMAAVGEPLVIHRRGARGEIGDRVVDLLERVGLSSEYASYYPHQLSGGQRQRVSIARALAVEPPLLVCDEPTSALDVSIQAQVVEVFQHLQREEDVTYLFITHDLALLPQLTEVVAVMYLGRIVEYGPVRDVLLRPQHPYTNSLVSAAPVLGERRSERSAPVIRGDAVADDVEGGCIFRRRCWLHAQLGENEARRCREETPMTVIGDLAGERAAACHFPDRVPGAHLPEATVAVRSPERHAE